MSEKKQGIWSNPLLSSKISSPNVKPPEMLFGYLIGPFGALMAFGIFTSQLQNYLTNVLKLDLGFLTGLQLFSTILIVAANLVVGQLIERTKTLAGKARPWILLSALTLSVSSVLMFSVPFENQTARMVWIAIAYNLYYAVGFSIYNTANSTLVPVSTRNSGQRATLASFTNIASLGVMGVGSMIFPALVSMVLKEDQNLWFVAMLAVAIFTALTILLQFQFTRERVTEESGSATAETKASSISIGDQLKAAAGEKMWWLVILFYVGFQWTGAMKNGSMTFFCQWVLDNSFFVDLGIMENLGDAWGASQSLLAILGAIPMALAATVVVPLANKFGKRQTAFVGMVVGVIGGIIAGLGGSNIVPVAIGVALKCLGSAPACYLILAMLADVIDHIEFTSNIRTDGLTMSVYSALMVAGTPICNAIFSGILGASGYNQNANVALNTLGQSAVAQSAISISYIWVEAVGYAICALLIFLWTVEKNLPEEQAAIAARKKAR
ncbi:MAG: MFS transporter [Oscillospiraceae bacterium]|nr:MFS transporter [Oscillospiraceae bacterium]